MKSITPPSSPPFVLLSTSKSLRYCACAGLYNWKFAILKEQNVKLETVKPAGSCTVVRLPAGFHTKPSPSALGMCSPFQVVLNRHSKGTAAAYVHHIWTIYHKKPWRRSGKMNIVLFTHFKHLQEGCFST